MLLGSAFFGIKLYDRELRHLYLPQLYSEVYRVSILSFGKALCSKLNKHCSA